MLDNGMHRSPGARLLVLALLLALIIAGCGPAPSAEPTRGEPTPQPPAPEQPTAESGADEQPAFGPIFARDAVLGYLAGAYGSLAPAAGQAWAEKDITNTALVGGSTFEYSTAGWTVTVQYPIVAPQSTIYQVVVDGPDNGFHWEGEVNASGEVRELVLPDRGDQVPEPSARDATPDVGALVDGNSAFALDLYQQLRQQEGNLFYSPYSISTALAMTYGGARGQTEAQMAEALHFGLPQEALHASFEALAQELESRGEGAQGKDGEGFRLNVSNGLWLQEDFELLPAYLDLMDRYYEAALRFVNFAGAAEEARQAIHDQVAEDTEGRITELVPPGALDALTRLVLTNAIYFNAAWATPFDDSLTRDAPFYLLNGGEVTVPMMRQNETLGYTDGGDFQAVELPYDGGELSMIVLLPAEGQFEAFEASLDAERLAAIEQGLLSAQVDLSMPRFEFDDEFSLAEQLAALGMADAFTDAADFSGMTGGRDLFISQVFHKAFVSVDEAGTEAAAATAVVMQVTGAPAEAAQVILDRPFLFLIRDRETGALLFLGRVMDPSQ